jgi:hypothetical protein
MKIIRPALLAGSLLALGGCDNNNSPPPPPPVVTRPPDPPPPIIITDQLMPPPQAARELSMTEGFPCYLPVFEGAHPGWIGRPPNEWQFPDTANTSSTEDLWLSKGIRPIGEAQWVIDWEPKNTSHFGRFIYMPMSEKEGYGTWTEICQIQGAEDKYGWGPRSFRFNCTEFFQQARLTQHDLYIGFQVKGDGITPMTVWKSRLLFWLE